MDKHWRDHTQKAAQANRVRQGLHLACSITGDDYAVPMRTSHADAALIVQSLEIAAERAGDLTGRVYERLFERQPAMRTLFWRDSDGAIKGEMLARVFDAILDFVGERRYAHRMIQCEAVNHEGLDVPRDVFATFFGVVSECIAEAVGPDWTAAMSEAWLRMLNQLDFYVRHPEQHSP